jgi:hypothetical protein
MWRATVYDADDSLMVISIIMIIKEAGSHYREFGFGEDIGWYLKWQQQFLA